VAADAVVGIDDCIVEIEGILAVDPNHSFHFDHMLPVAAEVSIAVDIAAQDVHWMAVYHGDCQCSQIVVDQDEQETDEVFPLVV